MNKKKQLGVALLVGTMLLSGCAAKYPVDEQDTHTKIVEEQISKGIEIAVEKTFSPGDIVLTADFVKGNILGTRDKVTLVFSGETGDSLVFTKLSPTRVYVGDAVDVLEYSEVEVYYPIRAALSTPQQFGNNTWTLVKYDWNTGKVTLKIAAINTEK